MTTWDKTHAQKAAEAETSRTGWHHAMLQDEHGGLSEWLSRDPNARQHARDSAAKIRVEKAPYIPLGCDQGGLVIDGVRHWPAEACSDEGLNEDQSDNAWPEAAPAVLVLLLVVLAAIIFYRASE